MNKEQFIFWLKGFAKAVNEEGPTPGQWGIIASELGKIKDCPDYGSPIDEFKPNPIWQEPHHPNPYKAGKTDTKVMYGSSGTIIATPEYGSITYNPSTITQMYPSGSAWSYTNTLSKQPTTVSNQLELDLE